MAQFIEDFEEEEKHELTGPPPGMEGHEDVQVQVEYKAPKEEKAEELPRSASLLPEVMEPNRAISEVVAFGEVPKPKDNKKKQQLKGDVPEIEEA